ncbi:hypothetical protein GCHA_0432 [Paraglaciecola chathamensis S18K6]|uniref:Uncharacterized protein n=2 Tax=Paraglaciecola chathamensis TaxID=368405 RepID=A0ABQ0IC97_9ALTE|nr:hypothetical protein GAGA_4065 [Paraglaciecola agarilytica NO2]GAC08396.1 hypothetical protein GCHA_0432 [Paraglaciecola chathamensis S18K6]
MFSTNAFCTFSGIASSIGELFGRILEHYFFFIKRNIRCDN